MSIHYTSVTRIADLEGVSYEPLPRERWGWGDYVLANVVVPPGGIRSVEYPSGRLGEIDLGDLIVGAFATREATLEATGSWEEIGDDGRFDLLTPAGLFCKLRTKSPMIGTTVKLAYRAHAMRDGEKVTMLGSAPPPSSTHFDLPVILIVGSSMSAGKTASGKKIIRRLNALGKSVVAAKLTGAGRMRDGLALKDAGAIEVFDFVDCGLPSTVCDEGTYRKAVGGLLGRLAETGADVAVIEAGASPLEPYNGEACLDLLHDNIKILVLCASDPYAVVGIAQAFDRPIDLVSGIATNTDAGCELIDKLTGIPAERLIRTLETPITDGLLRTL